MRPGLAYNVVYRGGTGPDLGYRDRLGTCGSVVATGLIVNESAEIDALGTAQHARAGGSQTAAPAPANGRDCSGDGIPDGIRASERPPSRSRASSGSSPSC